MVNNVYIDIYVDVLFVINFLINGAVFYAVCIIFRRRLRPWLFVGAAVSALLYAFLVFTPLMPWLNAFTSIVILSPGLYIAFRPVKVKAFCHMLVLCYVSAFALAGLSLLLGQAGRDNMELISNAGMVSAHITWQNLAVANVITLLILSYLRRHINQKTLSRQSFCLIELWLSGRNVRLKALVDTGNSLIEPISQSPVIIAELNGLRPILPSPISLLFNNNEQDDLPRLIERVEEAGMRDRLRMVPFKAIGKGGMLLGFRLDKITIKGKDMQAIVALCDFALSNEGEYEALVHPMLVLD